MPSYNIYAFTATMFVISSLLLAAMVGGGGLLADRVNDATNITATETVIILDDASAFCDDGGYVKIDDEFIYYPSHTGTNLGAIATPCLRGQKGTTATTHLDNAVVLSEDNGIIINIFNFDFGALFKDWGVLAIGAVPFKLFSETLPYLAQSNIVYLFSGELAILAVFAMACITLPFILVLVQWGMNWVRGN
jgi:hypothetical protein